MSLILVALAASAATHSISVDHHGTAVEAVYSARTDINARTIGAHTPNRMDGRRCHWTATVVVDRALAHGPTMARTIASDRSFSGTHAGACSGDKSGIHREIAAREDEIRAHLIAVAERDRPVLTAELASLRSLAAN